LGPAVSSFVPLLTPAISVDVTTSKSVKHWNDTTAQLFAGIQEHQEWAAGAFYLDLNVDLASCTWKIPVLVAILTSDEKIIDTYQSTSISGARTLKESFALSAKYGKKISGKPRPSNSTVITKEELKRRRGLNMSPKTAQSPPCPEQGEPKESDVQETDMAGCHAIGAFRHLPSSKQLSVAWDGPDADDIYSWL